MGRNRKNESIEIKNMANKLFRQQALDTVSSPEKINDYIRVTTPSFYLWLLTLLVVLLSVVLWAFNSTVSDFVKIQGVAFPHQGIQEVSSPFGGRVTELFIRKGQQVKVGDILMRYMSDNALRELRSDCSGVVLAYKGRQEAFNAYEPTVFLIPDGQEERMRELIAFVTYSDLRKLKIGMSVQATPSDLTREEYGYMYGRITDIDYLPVSKAEVENHFKLSEFTTSIFPSETAFMVKILLESDERSPQGIRWSQRSSRKVRVPLGTFCQLQIVTRTRSVYELLLKHKEK